MRVTGIIAECNPLHEGHKYLIREARRQTGADFIVIALSGDYVQRGAPSILSYEARTKALLDSGADLVVQLPLYTACSGADYFARGAAALMESLGVVTDLAFGSESGDLGMLENAAGTLSEESEEFRASLQARLREGLSYPRARALAAGESPIPNSPNDLLATEYLRALGQSGSRIRPLAIGRISCKSASQIRGEMIGSRQNTDPFLCSDDFSDLLLHALYREDSPAALTAYLDVSEDLAGRILSELPRFTTLSEFCKAVKTRNYTYTRISRALMHILLGMTDQTMERFDHKYGLSGWIRPLGFRRDAAPLIKNITASCTVPFLDKLARAGQVLPQDLYSIFLEDLRAEFLYDLMAARRAPSVSAGVVPAFRKKILILDPSAENADSGSDPYKLL